MAQKAEPLIFDPGRQLYIPTQDITSWTFDAPGYDVDKPIYVDCENTSNSISNRQARKLIRQLIAGFRKGGVKQGDCVLVHSFNDIYYSVLFQAIIGAGAVFTGTNPAYTPYELAHHIKVSKASFLISEPEILPALLEASKQNGISKEQIRIFDPTNVGIPKGFQSWKELCDHGEADWVRFDDLQTAKETTAARLFSSGTTGLPKAVEISHYNLVAQHIVAIDGFPKPYDRVQIVAIPSFHAASVPSTHISSLKIGYTIYMMRRFDLEKYLNYFMKYKVTDLNIVPPMAVAIVKSPISRDKPWFATAKIGQCGAAPLDKGTQAEVQALLPEEVAINQGWGMTEISCAGTLFGYPERDNTGSVGRLVPNLFAKLIDEEGNNISQYNVPGELCVKGPTVVKGYFENPKANAEAFDKDGWFKTGDIFYCAPGSHKWYIVDRSKELIKVRGFQVSPSELEGVLLSHPQVADACVIGVPTGDGDDEMPRAYVVRRPDTGGNLTAEAVTTYVNSRLAKYKSLGGGVFFLDAIPKNPSGKILRRVLREEAKKQRMSSGPKL